MEDSPEEPKEMENNPQKQSPQEESANKKSPQKQPQDESSKTQSVQPPRSRGIFGSRSPIEIIIVILILKHLFRGRKLFG